MITPLSPTDKLIAVTLNARFAEMEADIAANQNSQAAVTPWVSIGGVGEYLINGLTDYIH